MRKLDLDEKSVLAITGVFFLIWLTAVVGISYVAIHFVTKFW